MFLKLVAMTLMMACIYSGLLILRQQRLELMNESTELYYGIIESREALWQAQTRLAPVITQANIAAKLQNSELAFEPDVPRFERAQSDLAETKPKLPMPYYLPE